MRIERKPGPQGLRLRDAVSALNAATAKVGWFESAQYPDGTPVAMVAIVQEFGSALRKIPPRPYMRVAQQEQQGRWKEDAGRLARAVAQGKLPPAALMQGLAMKAEGDVRRAITRVLTPELKPATIRARERKLSPNTKRAKHLEGLPVGIAKPLVDTALLLNTLTTQTGKK